MNDIELLSPVGSKNKLYTALHFGADAIYLAGKNFGLRAYADNFSNEEILWASKLCHSQGKKIYITLNIFASNADFGYLKEYLDILYQAEVDGIIVSDIGMISFIKKYKPSLDIHLSTQANTTNKYSVKFWQELGLKRVVLARELNLDQIKEIKDFVGESIELEAFIHGAMCISYSGRCLLSSYLANRDSNRGECVQSCRWEYKMHEISRPNKVLTISEDERGTYILNSKDMCTMPFVDKIINAGISSLKIEGRMKSEYYVGCVTNAYRKRIDDIYCGEIYDKKLMEELFKVSHREYTNGFYLEEEAEVCYETSKPQNTYDFIAEVKGYDEEKGAIVVEQRNRFYSGDILEVVSSTKYHNKEIKADYIYNEKLEQIYDCKKVQEILYIKSDKRLEKYDIMRKRRNK